MQVYAEVRWERAGRLGNHLKWKKKSTFPRFCTPREKHYEQFSEQQTINISLIFCDLLLKKVDVSGERVSWKVLHSIHDLEKCVKANRCSKNDCWSIAPRKLQGKCLSWFGYLRRNYPQSFEEMFSFEKCGSQFFAYISCLMHYFKFKAKIRILEFPRQCCCFSRRKTKVLDIVSWLDSPLDKGLLYTRTDFLPNQISKTRPKPQINTNN